MVLANAQPAGQEESHPQISHPALALRTRKRWAQADVAD